MGTHRIDILSGLIPDASGSVRWEVSSQDDTNDRYPHEVLSYDDTATKILAYGKFTVPKNYVGTAKLVIRWKTTATSNNVVWDFDYKAIANGESLDPSSDDENLTVTDAAAGTARLANDCEMTFTSANLAVDDVVLFALARDGANGSDNMAAKAQIEEAWFQYADA